MIGIAVGASTVACGMTRVGASEDVEFEDVADCEIVTFDEADIERRSLRADVVVGAAGVAGLNCTRFSPTEVVLNCMS